MLFEIAHLLHKLVNLRLHLNSLIFSIPDLLLKAFQFIRLLIQIAYQIPVLQFKSSQLGLNHLICLVQFFFLALQVLYMLSSVLNFLISTFCYLICLA